VFGILALLVFSIRRKVLIFDCFLVGKSEKRLAFTSKAGITLRSGFKSANKRANRKEA
jgi:hypothetical protein